MSSGEDVGQTIVGLGRLWSMALTRSLSESLGQLSRQADGVFLERTGLHRIRFLRGDRFSGRGARESLGEQREVRRPVENTFRGDVPDTDRAGMGRPGTRADREGNEQRQRVQPEHDGSAALTPGITAGGDAWCAADAVKQHVEGVAPSPAAGSCRLRTSPRRHRRAPGG